MIGVGRMSAALALAAGMAALMAPALWNGFPLLQWDTGGYLARWYEGYLVPSRSTVYGLFLVAGWPLDFWPTVVVQSALTLWVIRLVLRAQGAAGPVCLLAAIAALCVLTTLPFLTGILLTDIFAGLSVLAMHLILFQDRMLRRAERHALVLLVAFSAATHSATFAMLVALAIAAAALRLFRLVVMPATALLRACAALLLGALMLLSANFALSGRLAWTPGGYGILFGRMLEDGIVKRYLREHCPDPRLRLCAHQDEIPENADAFLWGQGVFDRLGRFDGLDAEMRTIVLESVKAYPGLQLKSALLDFARQLARVESGEGVLNVIWHTYMIVRERTPSASPAMDAARQQRGEIGFDTLNLIHVPVALLGMALLPAAIWSGCRDGHDRRPALLALSVAIAILANAAICGILANPHPRYGARVAWLAPLAVMTWPLRRFASAGRPLAHGIRIGGA